MLLDSDKSPDQLSAQSFLQIMYAWHECMPQQTMTQAIEACEYYFKPRAYFMAAGEIPWRYAVKDFKNPKEPFIAVIKTIDPTEPDDEFEVEKPIIVVDFFDLKSKILHRLEHDTANLFIELKAVDLHDKEIRRIQRRFDPEKQSYIDDYNDFPIRESRFRYNIA